MHCGRLLSGVRWVAATPDAFRPRVRTPARAPYAGPPAYREVPRWSLWPWAAAAAPGTPDGPPVAADALDPDAALRAAAGFLRRLATTTALLAVLAAGGEAWRYGLLLASRSEALDATALDWSDAVVTLTGLLAPVAALATGVVFVGWLLRARERAATLSGTRPVRSTTAVVAGTLLPPATLAVPGAVLAEIEHAGSGRPSAERPRPSRPVALWWAGWVASVVLGLVVVLHGALASSTQALADGVVLHGVADLLAAATAVLTVRVVDHLTALLAPELRTRGRAWVVRAADDAEKATVTS